MLTLERYGRIRALLENRARAVAQKYSITLGGMNSYTDVTNLLGPSLEPLGQEYLNNHFQIHIPALWAMRRYLRLIERYPLYREGEAKTFPSERWTCAFPQIREKAEKVRRGKSPLVYYVQKSEELLKKCIA